MIAIKEKKLKNREALMEASLNEFSEVNYEMASLNNIIKTAEVSKGSFYYHFDNKEDLYGHLLKQSVEAKWLYISKYTEENKVDFDKMDIFDKFLYQAKVGMMFANEYPRYNKLASMFSKEKGNEIYDKMIDIIGGNASGMLEAMVSEAYDKGELDTSFDKSFTQHLLEKLFANYDDFFETSDVLDRNLDKLESFVRFMKSGLKSK